MSRLLVATVLAALGGAACDTPPSGGAPPPEEHVESAVVLPRPVPLVIAHRGASAHAPEHTFAAWDRAVEAGADYLELDLQMTADSVPVVFHDETLERTARGPGDACVGPVRERTLEELGRCEVGSWFGEAWTGVPLPTLDAVLGRYPDARFYVETKEPESAPGLEEALVGALRRHGRLPVGADRGVIVQSFSEASLRRVATLEPSIPLVRLFRGRESEASIWRQLPLVAGYAVGIGPAAADVRPELVEAAHAHCLEVHPYTVNDPAEATRLLDAGVDGLFTDDPARMGELRDARPRRPARGADRCPAPAPDEGQGP